MSQAFSDASIVYGHRVLPSSLRDHLPPIDNSWGAYGAEARQQRRRRRRRGHREHRTRLFDGRVAHAWAAASRRRQRPRSSRDVGRRNRCHHGCSGAARPPQRSPHFPWKLSRSGYTTTYSQASRPEAIDRDQPGYDFRIRVEFQLHSMQTGAVDALLDEALEQLMSLPTWDDTLLVVTSDHGISLTPPDVDRRRVPEANRAEVYRVPLFIKAPGQTTGEIRDDSAQTIDIVPSIVDLLDIEVDDNWEFDGHSLYDGSERPTLPRLCRPMSKRPWRSPNGDPRSSPATTGSGWQPSARTATSSEDISDLTIGLPSRYTATLRDEALLEDLPTDEGSMPYVLTGTVAGPSDDAPPELLAAVNGRIAGVVGGTTRRTTVGSSSATSPTSTSMVRTPSSCTR